MEKARNKFLNDVCRMFLSVSPFSSFSGRRDVQHKVRPGSRRIFERGREKKGRVKRREDDRETRVVHPDYKRNGFHVWSFNEAKTIAGEEEKKT